MDQNIFFSQQDADYVAGDHARKLMSRMETRASSLIIFCIFVDCHTQRIISVYEDTNIHYISKTSVACNVFHRLALLIKMEHALGTQPSRDVYDVVP